MENGFDRPYNFCQYTTDIRLTCTRCQEITSFSATIDNFLVLVLTQQGTDSMRQAIQDKLQSFNEGRICRSCRYRGMTEDVVFHTTKQFFHIQITSPFGRCIHFKII